MGHHALVFGASGILGWAVVNEILNDYPEEGVYSKVTALTNRPLTLEDALWPKPDGQTPELNIVSGIDLTKGTMEDVKAVLKDRVPDIDTVTQVHYFGTNELTYVAIQIECSPLMRAAVAYSMHPDFPTESEINLGMLKRGFGAVESLAPNLEFVIFPTGTKVRWSCIVVFSSGADFGIGIWRPSWRQGAFQGSFRGVHG